MEYKILDVFCVVFILTLGDDLKYTFICVKQIPNTYKVIRRAKHKKKFKNDLSIFIILFNFLTIIAKTNVKLLKLKK
jgi:hypothetical protein